MVDCWMNFFDLVTHVVREAELKEAGSPNSKTVESICGKLEHCIENVDKLRYLVEDAIGARDSAHDDFLTEYDYRHSQLQSQFLCGIYKTWHSKFEFECASCVSCW